MRRFLRTGTGPGDVLGTVRLGISSIGDLRACTAEWDGAASLVPLLPGIAFDQFLPNVRVVSFAGRDELRANSAQAYTLQEFDSWVARAATALGEGGALPLYRGDSSIQGQRPDRSARLVVRVNMHAKRLWGEVECPDKDTERLSFGVVHKVVWDWVARSDQIGEKAERLIAALQAQSSYYRESGIPSDFRLRQVGRAPFTAWQCGGESLSTRALTSSEEPPAEALREELGAHAASRLTGDPPAPQNGDQGSKPALQRLGAGRARSLLFMLLVFVLVSISAAAILFLREGDAEEVAITSGETLKPCLADAGILGSQTAPSPAEIRNLTTFADDAFSGARPIRSLSAGVRSAVLDSGFIFLDFYVFTTEELAKRAASSAGNDDIPGYGRSVSLRDNVVWVWVGPNRAETPPTEIQDQIDTCVVGASSE